ncbi:MAG: NAD(P)-dependent oxidoreductase [Clostridiales bacterium]|nr:NAD(P)-dependent oxidoreductase [Clostridiales bacterium]
MKVVVIQEAIIQPDLSKEGLTKHWKKLQSIPEVTELVIQYPEGYPSNEELHQLIGDADAAIGVWISDHNINEDFLAEHPNLKYVATLGHGWGEFDVEMTRKKNMTITNTIYGAQTIAEYAWSLLMEVCHHTTLHSELVKHTIWSEKNMDEFGHVITPQIELYGKTCGVVGLGSIGLAFANMARGFGMHVLSYSRHKKIGPQYDFVEQVSFEELLERSDVISLHAPFSESSANMINQQTISKMKDGVILINTARGGLIVEEDLTEALNSGKIYGAGLDVLREEPPKHDLSLLHCDNAIITAHIAWLTKESRLRACDMAIDNFKNYLAGSPTSVIN